MDKSLFFENLIKLGELNYRQQAYNDQLKVYLDDRARGSISPSEKWNLKMDIIGLKKDLIDLQNTAAELPDEFVGQLCDTENYPFDNPIDDDYQLNDWCCEIDEFLSNDLDQWGKVK